MTIHVLDDLRAHGPRGMSNVQIAGMLGVTEAAVRYHLRRRAAGAGDGRSNKQSLIERHGLESAVKHWWEDQLEHLPSGRSPNATTLWQMLVDEHGYPGSCKSVRKYVRERFPRPKLRPFRRIETPPGAQTQSDWLEMTLGFDRLCFDGLDHLQAYTDQKLDRLEQRRLCPATGKTVAQTWASEKTRLRPLPGTLPEPFDCVRDCPVHPDCTIRFEGRTYAVPFAYVGRRLEARGCAAVVQIVDKANGRIVTQYPRKTAQRVLIDPACYEGPSTESVCAPVPLGRMSRKLQQIAAQTPQVRSIEMYAMLAEVSR